MQKVCLVIPCYNEAARLRETEWLGFLARCAEARLCFVDDGSTDGTLELLQVLGKRDPRRIWVLSLPKNRGKAEAVRHGVIHASTTNECDFIGYWDADLATPLSTVDDMLAEFATTPGCVLTMGSRLKRLGSTIERRSARHIAGRVFATLASWILGLPIYDSQCGAKLFRCEIASVLFRDPFITRWLFDVEILARLRNHLGTGGILRSVVELPLKAWTEVGDSKLRINHLAKVPMELLRIGWRYNRSK